MLLVIYLFIYTYSSEFLFIFIEANILSIIIILSFRHYKKLKENELLKLLGKYTLPIYLIHCYFTAGTRIILNKLNVDNLLIYLISGITLSIVVPIGFYKFCTNYEFLSCIFKPSKILNKNIKKQTNKNISDN